MCKERAKVVNMSCVRPCTDTVKFKGDNDAMKAPESMEGSLDGLKTMFKNRLTSVKNFDLLTTAAAASLRMPIFSPSWNSRSSPSSSRKYLEQRAELIQPAKQNIMRNQVT
jgi:hypothetical protein